ncbi:SOS response-associated peptidase family protein [Paenarthrobacter sp. YIM B13468]|uniref:SOS response-associated peptidase family protein n=1 Tax=Paenarthrobacter sp. YIM B13468 TaxID=3366295 RepID=UPI003670284C
MPIVAERLDEGTIDRRLLIARWCLIPSRAKDAKIGSKLIDARSESILEKPSFRSAASGQFKVEVDNHEWQGRSRQHQREDKPFTGLWAQACVGSLYRVRSRPRQKWAFPSIEIRVALANLI